jgi:phosphoenolpyruvate carboxykinase (ATP)
MEVSKFDSLYSRLLAYLQGRDLFANCFVDADERYRTIRVISGIRLHSLCTNLIRGSRKQRSPTLNSVIDAPHRAVPTTDGTRSETPSLSTLSGN